MASRSLLRQLLKVVPEAMELGLKIFLLMGVVLMVTACTKARYGDGSVERNVLSGNFNPNYDNSGN